MIFRRRNQPVPLPTEEDRKDLAYAKRRSRELSERTERLTETTSEIASKAQAILKENGFTAKARQAIKGVSYG